MRAKKPETEREFQRRVVALAERYGWQCHHTPNQRFGQTSAAKGFPDLVLRRGVEMLVAELKTDRGAVKPEQKEWLELFSGYGVEAYLWRPRDWNNIVGILAHQEEE